MPTRMPGTLFPVESAIIRMAHALMLEGGERFYGYRMSRLLREDPGSTLGSIGFGTLYKALCRLEDLGLLDSVLEDPATAESEGRPRRRLYRLTRQGAEARVGAAVVTQDGSVAVWGIRDGHSMEPA